MTSNIGWEFPSNGGGASEGHNNAVDMFAGQRLSAMVREVIQNSLDAKPQESYKPVKIAFSLDEIESGVIHGFDELNAHVKACEDMANQHKLPHVAAYYRNASDSLGSKKKVPVLTISDFNTTGLIGPLDEPRGPWFALTKGTGITQKQNSSSLGSFGHGSKAPFLMADLRTLYYLTKVSTDDGDQYRFQGKSILLSHEHPKNKGVYTQATGFFGHKDHLKPLVDDDVPNWARQLRDRVTDGYGTSIIIPHTSFDEGLFPETIITVVANFFYAIREGRLEVTVNGNEITRANIEEKFQWCVENLPNERDEINVEHIEGCFKSIRTILDATHKNSQEIPGFGRIDWYLRLGDDVDYKSVAISRESGMLITRRPPQLVKFPGIKQFDMFVFINPGAGSGSLKRLENPEHNNFEPDRIKGASDEKQVLAHYKKLTGKIREVLRSYAEVETTEEEDISDLAKYLLSASDEGVDDGANERGTRIKVHKGRARAKNRRSQPGPGRKVPGGGGTGGRKPIGPGGGGGSGGRGNGPGETDGPGGDRLPVPASLQLENLRAVPIGARGSASQVKLFFDIFEAGDYEIEIHRASETKETDVVKVISDGRPTTKKRIVVATTGRQSITVELVNPEDANFALEGWVNEISQ